MREGLGSRVQGLKKRGAGLEGAYVPRGTLGVEQEVEGAAAEADAGPVVLELFHVEHIGAEVGLGVTKLAEEDGIGGEEIGDGTDELGGAFDGTGGDDFGGYGVVAENRGEVAVEDRHIL